MKKNTKRVGIVGGAVATLIGGGVAFAAFTSTGAFEAHGTTGQPLSLTADGGSIGDLWPGGCSDATVTFHNPNTHDATVDLSKLSTGSVSLTGALTSLNPNLGQVPGIGAVVAAGRVFTVPAGQDASFTIPKLVCLSGTATNSNLGEDVALTGTVPFVLANDSDFAG
jgi:hypothetical protein